MTASPGRLRGEARQADSPLRRRTFRRFLRHRLAMFGLVAILALIALALLGNEQAALRQNLGQGHQAPSLQHWFGTDALGRDVFHRVLVGGRISLVVGLVAVFFSTSIGLLVGSLAGYYRRLDFAMMRVVDVVMSFPLFILLLLAAAFVGPGIFNIMVLIGLISWPIPCRIVRSQFLQLRDAEFVIAAGVIGARDRTIVLRHILPNATAPLLVYVSLGVASAVLLEAALSYLGLGVQPPTPSWGNLLNSARSPTVLSREPWQWLPAAMFVVLFVLSVNFVGDGIRDAVDPRSSQDHA